MPLLAQMLITLFGGLFAFFVKALGIRFAVAAAGVAAFSALTLALYGAAALLVGGISSAIPGGAHVLTGIWLVVPDNGAVCLAAVFACDALAALYRWNASIVRLAVA